MEISRTGLTVRVTNAGSAADDTNFHTFEVVEDYCTTEIETIAAEDGYAPKACLEYQESGTRDQLGTHWWERKTPPRSVRAHLEANGYVVL